MESSTTITPNVLAVQPGGEVECQVRVRNISTIVDQFSFEALGPAAPWAEFEPSSVSLFPDAEGMVRLILRPPKGPETPAGSCPIGVWVRSQEDPANSVVEELTAEIGRLLDINAELIPRTSRHARAATHTLAVDNRGNSRLTTALSARDPDDRLRFEFEPDSMTAEAGEAGFAKVRVIPLKRFWRGPEVHHSFEVLLQPAAEAPVSVPGTMVQQALIPRWVPRALLAALALTVLAAGLWAVLLRPVVKTTARAVARDTVGSAIRENSAQTADLVKQMAQQSAPAAGGAGGAGGSGTTTSTTAPPPATGIPYDGRLEATAANQAVSFPIPAGQRLSLTDIVLQNPAGDSGLLRIQRGATTLLAVRLENFRDLDYHFVTPVVFTAGEPLTLAVECANVPPSQPNPCTPAAYFNGTLEPE